MNVHLIRTPEYAIGYFEEVHELLSALPGPMKFIASTYEFNSDQFSFLEKYSKEFRFPHYESDVTKTIYDNNRGTPLSWKELFSLCTFYRNVFKIDRNDFVILLTERKNALNHFSAFDMQRNAFVHTGDWEYYTKAPQKYPVAYEAVENILQTLMKIDVGILPNPNIHFEPIGCMNDFCRNKKEIVLKLRTADICHDCLSKMTEEKVSVEIINQALGIFEQIRSQLLFKQGFTKNLKPQPVRINTNGKIYIGNTEINLNPIESTLFIFFITSKQGVTLNDLKNHKEKLLRIYRTIRPYGEDASIVELTKPYYDNGTFSVNKSRLNKQLKSQLGEPLANFYCLDRNSGATFNINIDAGFVTADIRY